MSVEHIAGRATNHDKLDVIEEHLHGTSMTYPELAAPVTLTSAAGAWAAYPTPTEIIPASTITNDFDIHHIGVSTISANGEYMLQLYEGGAGSETLICEVDISRTAIMSQEGATPVITKIIAKNTRISGAISSDNAGANTINIKIRYHTY